jgi:ankyrin repeat protein
MVLFKCSNNNCTDNDTDRNTLLIYAAMYGHVKVVRVLLEGGANVDRANDGRSTALHLGALYGHLDVCRLLLDWGAKVDHLDKRHYTPLHDAARGGHLSVVKLLVERGADVTVKGYDGQPASDVARSYGKKAVAEWLDTVRRGLGQLTL